LYLKLLPQFSSHVNDFVMVCVILYDEARVVDMLITISESSSLALN